MGGAAPSPAIDVRVTDAPLDTDAASPAGDAGAAVVFTGICRSENGRLRGLELETYPEMARDEIVRIAAQAAARWPLTGVRVAHRHGRIGAGETIVVVEVSSRHREAAFDGARFLMDWLKTSAPFWKREILADGSRGEWIAASEADEEAARRWQPPDSG